MLSALAKVLDLILQPCYALTHNWWLSILLFTVIVKIILLPMSLWCQKNSIVMVQLMPALNRIKVKYFGDRETIGDAQNALYKERHYHPMLSLVPLAVQIIILFGLVEVIHTITDGGAPGTEFLGKVPTVDGGLSWIMPILAGISAIIMGFAQNRINPLQKEQSRAEKNMTNGLSIALSFILGIFVAAGMAFYWICSNLMSIAIQWLCNIIIKPKKYIDYEDLEASRQELAVMENVGAEEKIPWYKPNPLRRRERADYKRFLNTVDKRIVFYSEKSGFWKYLGGYVEYLLAHGTGNIHYITNDPNDAIFERAKAEPRIKPYYISEKKCITAFMKMDCDIFVSTLEDLDNYYLKRSLVRDDVEYVFTFHHITSVHMTATPHAYDHNDTLFCVGPHQVTELRRAEELYGLPKRNLVEVGYTLLDNNIRELAKAKDAAAGEDGKGLPTVLIGPSWTEGNLLDSCIDPMLEGLVAQQVRTIVRPHPEYVKRFKPRWQALKDRWAAREDGVAALAEGRLEFQEDFSRNDTVFMSDVLVTDWSSIAYEFSFSTCKPCIFVDTPTRIKNPDWEQYGLPCTDLTLRDEIGVRMAPENTGELGARAAELIEHAADWSETIDRIRHEYVFNLGHADEAGGEYLLQGILARQAAREGAEGKEARHA
ncbi:MAG: membrane protein insertase YidC [Eggerthellaceae bacterium]|nr:membrane protein insertase YidC [Eggerthellaceae bacterium]